MKIKDSCGVLPVADPEGGQGVRSQPLNAPVFKYPIKMKYFGLRKTKLFHFHGIFKKNEIKSAKRTPTQPNYTYEPPFRKSWIRPWLGLCFSLSGKHNCLLRHAKFHY